MPADILSGIKALANQIRPHSKNNKDSIQFEYLFWSDVKKIAEKQRAKALADIIGIASDISKSGVIIRGAIYETDLVISEPRRTFDKELFIDKLIERFPELPRHTLRELATASVVGGTRSSTYTVEPIDD